MQESTAEGARVTVFVKHAAVETHVPGFAELYAEYVRLHPGKESPHAFCGWLLMGLGVAACGAGILTLIFGPEMIYYSRFTGPTWFQLVQMYPGPLATMGGACMAIGNYLIPSKFLSPEAFFLNMCLLKWEDGSEVRGKVDVQYQGDEVFRVVMNEVIEPVGKR